CAARSARCAPRRTPPRQAGHWVCARTRCLPPDPRSSTLPAGRGRPRSPSIDRRPPQRCARRAGAAASPGRAAAGSAAHVVELTVLNPADEGGDLGCGVDQRRAGRIAGVADGDRATGQLGYLHAAPVRVAVAALAPDSSPQLAGRHAVVGLTHRDLVSSHYGTILPARYPDACAFVVSFCFPCACFSTSAGAPKVGGQGGPARPPSPPPRSPPDPSDPAGRTAGFPPRRGRRAQCPCQQPAGAGPAAPAPGDQL